MTKIYVKVVTATVSELLRTVCTGR